MFTWITLSRGMRLTTTNFKMLAKICCYRTLAVMEVMVGLAKIVAAMGVVGDMDTRTMIIQDMDTVMTIMRMSGEMCD